MAQSQLCQNCQHRKQKSRAIGYKQTLENLNYIKQLRQPRAIEPPFINLVEFIKTHRKNNSSLEIDDIPKFSNRMQTRVIKHQMEVPMEDATTTTSRLDQIPIAQPLYRGTSAKKIMSSAFYKMKQTRLTSRESQKRKQLEIGPIFNQVSKYVLPMRPHTVKSTDLRFLFEDVDRVLTSASARNLKHCKSEVTLRLPVSNKLSEVQSLMKRE